MMISVGITGMGALSAAGKDIPATLRTFQTGRRNAGPVSLFDSSLDCPVFEVGALPSAETEPDAMRTARLADLACREALASARLSPPLTGMRVGVCLGTSVACQLNDVEFYTALRETGEVFADPVNRFLKGNIADRMAAAVGAKGPRLTVANACSSGTDAIGTALSWLQSGLCDVVLAGGADEMNRIPYFGFHSLGIVSPTLCRPFDRDRQGLNLGEGAGVLVLETAAHAESRGVTFAIGIPGYGTCADAYHLTAPRPDGAGLEKAIGQALAQSSLDPASLDPASLDPASLEPGAIGFVNAHGTATHDNDLVEGTVLSRLFGPGVVVFSTKGYTGHTLGAAGGLEAVFTALALQEGWIPASAGFENKDDEIPLTPVTERTGIEGRYALSTSLAFGGNNSALLFEKK